jgi:hypothetical protein
MRLLNRDQQHDAGDHTDEVQVTSDDTDSTTAGSTATSRTAVPVPVAERSPTQEVHERRTTVRERTWTFAPGQIVSFAAGVGLLAVGLVALIRAGVDGSLGTPTVHVLSYSHTAWLGLAEVGLGLLLVLAGSGAWGRPISVLLGAATVVGGVLVLAEPGQMPDELGLEKNFGWPMIALGAVVALAAMTLPVWRRRKILDDDVLDLRSDRADVRTDDRVAERRVPF